MKINEVENENNHKFKIKKLKYASDLCDDKVLYPLENGASFTAFVGRPKSGKSTLMLNFLTKRCYYLKRFDLIYLYSPSIAVSLDEDHPIHKLPDERKKTELTAVSLQENIDEIFNSKKRVLFLLDDVIQDCKGHTLDLLVKLAYNRRNITKAGVSVWISFQVYNTLPLRIRKCLSTIFFFQSKSTRELESLRSENFEYLDKDEANVLFDYCFDKPHNFLMIKCNHQPKDMFFKNFNPLNLDIDNKTFDEKKTELTTEIEKLEK